jgi:hypothetical protein
VGSFLTSCKPVSFSRRFLLHGVSIGSKGRQVISPPGAPINLGPDLFVIFNKQLLLAAVDGQSFEYTASVTAHARTHTHTHTNRSDDNDNQSVTSPNDQMVMEDALARVFKESVAA